MKMLNIGLRGGLHKTNSFFFCMVDWIGLDWIKVCVLVQSSPIRTASSFAVSHIGCRRIVPSVDGVFGPASSDIAVLNSREIRSDPSSTYSLVQVDGVLAGHHVGDGRTGLLAGLDVGHFC